MEQRIYENFIRPTDLRGSSISAAILGAMFLLIGIAASLLFLFDDFVAPLAFRDWF